MIKSLRTRLAIGLALVAAIGWAGLVPAKASSVLSEQFPRVVISQVFASGGNTFTSIADYDYVELHNISHNPVDLTGWRLQTGGSGPASMGNDVALSGNIQPGQFLLIREGGGGQGGSAIPTPDFIGTHNLAVSGGKAQLLNPAQVGNIEDFVGYGNSSDYEGNSGPAPAPTTTTAVYRINQSCTDTNDNSVDFTTSPPAPRNSSIVYECGVPDETTATASQATSANIEAPPFVGTLAISLLQSTVNFGTFTAGETKVAGVGDIKVTNTLGDGATWSGSVAATSMTSGSNVVPFTLLSLFPPTTSTPGTGATGFPPNLAVSGGAFTGTDTTPGTTLSNPISLFTAAASTQGEYTLSGASLQVHPPIEQVPGSYTGVLQYTVLAGPSS